MLKTYAEWKVRVGSPRELCWELQRFLEKEGFKSDKLPESLILEPTPIEGHATFSMNIEGYRGIRRSSLWRLILGIILCFTIILIPLGLWLIKESAYELVVKLCLLLEGETFRASARSQDPYKPQSEVMDTVSNARIVIEGDVYKRRGDGKIKSASKPEEQLFDTILSEIKEKLDKLMPRIKLPDIGFAGE
ncbi:hypothetical protein ACFLVS_04925 [Chloroflexota bacterium]